MIINPSGSISGKDIEVKLQEDGRATYELELGGYSSGIYTAVAQKGNAQSSEKFSVGLQLGSGPIDAQTTQTEYIQGEKILLIGSGPIVIGQACSMGSLLASAGTKGKRFMLPHARHMIHQPLGGAKGQATDVQIQANELLRWKESLTKIYEKHTGQKFEKLKDDMERDKFMTADESIKYGLCDKIVHSRDEDNKH